jgi:hypothetical protein
MSSKKTPELVAKAKDFKRQGYSERSIAKFLKIAQTTVHCWLSPEARQLRNETERRNRVKRRGGPTARELRCAQHIATRPTAADISARLAEIPRDDRTDGQVICGEPLSTRSALYRRMHP